MPRGPIIYVDDEKENLESFKWVIKNEYDIRTALSGEEALRMMREQSFKVLVTDERMPKMSGLELIQQVNIENPDVICIVLTAYSEVQSMVKAINQGHIYKYMFKPWDGNELKLNLKNAIETYDLRFHNRQLLLDLQNKNKELEIKIQELNNTTDALLKSEDKFRNLFNSNNDGIIVMDLNHLILESNNAVTNNFGYERNEIINKRIYQFIPGEFHDLLKQRIKMLMHKEQVSITEIGIHGKNKNIIPVELNSKVINYESKESILTIIRDITERKEIRKRIFNAMLSAEEDERERIARDLHDGIGPLLSTSNIYIKALAETNDMSRKQNAMERLSETINEAIHTVQEISNNISPHILKNFGLTAAVQSFLNKLHLIKEIDFKVESNINERLDHTTEIILYRVIIELINNSLKYAEPTAIKIELIKEDAGIIKMFYVEDGKGFNIEKAKSNKVSMGLNNIYSRIESINGFIEMKSKPGMGMRVIVEIPAI